MVTNLKIENNVDVIGIVKSNGLELATKDYVDSNSSPWLYNASDIYFNTGNVGIGTSTPGTRAAFGNSTLDINGSRGTLLLRTTGAGVDDLSTLVFTGPTVGDGIHINYSPFTSSLNFQPLEGSVGSVFTIGPASLIAGKDLNMTGNFIHNTADPVDPQDVATKFYVDSNSSPWLYNVSDIYFNTGNVGIGTTTPTTILNIEKNTSSGSFGNYPSVYVENPNTSGLAYSALQLRSGSSALTAGIVSLANNDADHELDVVTYGAYPIKFSINSVEKMRVHSNGNVGIGANTSPGHKLTIDRPIATAAYVGVYDNTISAIYGISGDNKPLIGTVTTHPFYFLTDSVERAIISASGNFGIGELSPSEKLHIAGSIRIVDGNQAAGKVLTSNATGVGSWTSPYSVQALAGTSIDWSQAQTFTKTLSANTTFTFANPTAGQTIIVRLTNTASNYTVTWPTTRWAGGVAPVMSTGAVSDVYTFFYDGTSFYGSVVQSMS